MGVFRPGVLPGSHAGQCCLGASECLGSCGRPAPPPLHHPSSQRLSSLLCPLDHPSSQRLSSLLCPLHHPLLSASPHCSVPALWPLWLSLSLLAAVFRPLWLFPFLGRKPGLCRPGGCPATNATSLELPSTLPLLPPCSPCAVCFWGQSSSEARGLHKSGL